MTVVGGTNEVFIPISAFTIEYPCDGVAYAVPAEPASTITYPSARPFIHT